MKRSLAALALLLLLLPALPFSSACGTPSDPGPDAGDVSSDGGGGNTTPDAGDDTPDAGEDTPDAGEDTPDAGTDPTAWLKPDKAYLRVYNNFGLAIRLDGSAPNDGWTTGNAVLGGDVAGYVEVEPGEHTLDVVEPPGLSGTLSLEAGKAYLVDPIVIQSGSPQFSISLAEEPVTARAEMARFTVLSRREARRFGGSTPPTFFFELVDGFYGGGASLSGGTVPYGSTNTVEIEPGVARNVRIESGSSTSPNRSVVRVRLPELQAGDVGTILLTETGLAVLPRGKAAVQVEQTAFVRVMNTDAATPAVGYAVASLQPGEIGLRSYVVASGLAAGASTDPVATDTAAPANLSLWLTNDAAELSNAGWSPIPNEVVYAAIVRDARTNMPDNVAIVALTSLGSAPATATSLSILNGCGDNAAVAIREANGQYYTFFQPSEFRPFVNMTPTGVDPRETVDVRFEFRDRTVEFEWPNDPEAPARWTGVLACTSGTTSPKLYMFDELTGRTLTLDPKPPMGP